MSFRAPSEKEIIERYFRELFGRAQFEASSMLAEAYPRAGYDITVHGMPMLSVLINKCIGSADAMYVPCMDILPKMAVKYFTIMWINFHTDIGRPIDESYANFLAAVKLWEVATCNQIDILKEEAEELVERQHAADKALYERRVKQEFPGLLEKAIAERQITTDALATHISAIEILSKNPINNTLVDSVKKEASACRATIDRLNGMIEQYQTEIALFQPQ
jgi:hypothetical protein